MKLEGETRTVKSKEDSFSKASHFFGLAPIASDYFRMEGWSK